MVSARCGQALRQVGASGRGKVLGDGSACLMVLVVFVWSIMVSAGVLLLLQSEVGCILCNANYLCELWGLERHMASYGRR